MNNYFIHMAKPKIGKKKSNLSGVKNCATRQRDYDQTWDSF